MKRIDPAARHSAVLLTLLVLLVFVLAAWVVRRDSLSDVDRGARALIREGRPPALETPMRVVGTLGSGDVLLPVTVLCSVALWRRRHRALALWLPAIGLATGVTLALMKWVINKPRPTLRGYGFPSGHVFGATVFVLVALYLLWSFEAPRRWQRASRVAALVFVTVVGYSRIYVNAHWLSDVIGGLLAGIAFGLVTVLVLDARLR